MIRKLVEKIRKEKKWPNDDLLILIHAKESQRAIIEEFLTSIGIKDNDGVEITKGTK